MGPVLDAPVALPVAWSVAWSGVMTEDEMEVAIDVRRGRDVAPRQRTRKFIRTRSAYGHPLGKGHDHMIFASPSEFFSLMH
jgi:hypothetical protein